MGEHPFMFLFQMFQEQLTLLRARQSFQTGKTKPLEYRIQQLKRLQVFVWERRKDIAEALKRDLNKV